jgi:putative endonuclease
MRHWSETIAKRYLLSLGYDILEENYYSQGGEIDLIAKDEDCLVFVEVKQRSSQAYGGARAAIQAQKLARLQKAALSYLITTYKTDDLAVRFDAVLVQGSQQHYQLDHVKAIV